MILFDGPGLVLESCSLYFDNSMSSFLILSSSSVTRPPVRVDTSSREGAGSVGFSRPNKRNMKRKSKKITHTNTHKKQDTLFPHIFSVCLFFCCTSGTATRVIVFMSLIPSTGTSNAMAAYQEGSTCEPHTFALNPLGPDDVEIKLTHSGVCHSDLHTIRGDWGPLRLKPFVPGHEILGKVTAIGENVHKVKIGDVVGVGPFVYSCKECHACAEGSDNYCTKRVGCYGSALPNGYITRGGYAEYNRTNQHWVFKIPEAYGPEDYAGVAPLLCAGVTVFTPLSRYNVNYKSRVGVIGIGGLGHIAIKFAAAMGAQVTAISSSADKEEEAKSYGAQSFLVSSDTEQFKKFHQTFDIILCTVSAALDWNAYLNLLDFKGTFVQLGAPPGLINISAFSLLGRGLEMAGSAVGGPADYEAMFELAGRNKIKCVVEEFPFEKVNEVLAKMDANKIRYRGVLTFN